jgi:hypothetical protein
LHPQISGRTLSLNPGFQTEFPAPTKAPIEAHSKIRRKTMAAKKKSASARKGLKHGKKMKSVKTLTRKSIDWGDGT